MTKKLGEHMKRLILILGANAVGKTTTSKITYLKIDTTCLRLDEVVTKILDILIN